MMNCARLFSFLLIDQHGLLPFAGFLVGAVNAARPAAGAFLTFKQLFHRPFDPPCPRLFLFGVFNPTNKFISADGRQTFPETGDLFCLCQRINKVSGKFVHQTA